ncbi:MAG: hypothetical protein KTR31_33020 [Myxococcales bacterium]|nr:hypothetical protein [Myxococcales bacterium]
MSTIGVGKAFRDQDRAARAARAHREDYRRGTGQLDLPEVEGSQVCASCGIELARAEMLFGEVGLQCVPCHQDVPQAPEQPWRALLPLAGGVLGLSALVLWLGWLVSDGAQFGGRGPVGWFVTTSTGAVVGATLAAVSLRAMREASNPYDTVATQEDRAPAWGRVVAAGGLLVLATASSLAMVVLSLWPFL